ncbi:Uncharacterised protein [Chryseobacterium taklimakanense]|uniref:JAB domain-containing protein n=1 Tax=Chryseobacterium taklimakanense TaxID=536441 RepID=A0A239WP09_9FLAO|nr:Mov34/MPN/PAD-1 family protein [Chryseobacterium taklimakanense]SNV35354.1 Uncharacterised protein [Chryseobacterium taklimakanense]
MIFEYNNIRISISQTVIDGLNNFKQTGKKLEAGGVLMGSIFHDRIEILRISIPTPFDKSNRYGFVRDKRSAKIFIDYEFVNSKGKIIYLGEWHSHPEDYPTPSSQDIKMIREQYNENVFDEKFLLMLILGRKDIYLSIFDGKEIHQLVIL